MRAAIAGVCLLVLAQAAQAAPSAIPLAIPSATTPAPAPAGLDLDRLPSSHGTVARYVLTEDGDVRGLMLTDGTELLVSPRRSLAVVYAARPGDTVTAHGLPLRGVPAMLTIVLDNAARRVSVVTSRLGGRSGPGGGDDGDMRAVGGVVAAQLHGTDGALDGVLLADGTTIDLPDGAAARLAVGAPVYARGVGNDTPLGRVVSAEMLGSTVADAQPVGNGDGDNGAGGHDRGRDGGGRR